MTIQFEEIPGSIRKPGKYFEFNTKLAVRTLPANEQRMLIVAQMLAAGSADALTPVQVYDDAQAGALFGSGSMAHLMCLAAIKANPYLDLTVCALEDAGAGTAAERPVTITGPATGAGILRLNVGNLTVEIAIASAAVQNDIAAALNTELAKYGDLPVTGAVDTNEVTLTARNKGTVGNSIPISVEVTAPGVSVVVGALVPGATDPDLSTALAAVVAEQFHIIASPYTDATGLTDLTDHLDLVSGPMEQRPGVAVIAQTGAIATATTLAGTINHGRVALALLRGSRSIPFELAAAFAAVMAGEEDPAMPLNTLELKGIHAPIISQRFSRTEQETLLHGGVTPLEVAPGEKVRIVRAISTYTLDANGIEDISLLDITTIRTLDYVRKACRERIALRFPRAKLSSKTPPRVKSELLDVLMKLEDLEIVEEVAANKDGLIVERNLQDPNRLDAAIPTDVVNGLHVFAGRIDLLL